MKKEEFRNLESNAKTRILTLSTYKNVSHEYGLSSSNRTLYSDFHHSNGSIYEPPARAEYGAAPGKKFVGMAGTGILAAVPNAVAKSAAIVGAE